MSCKRRPKNGWTHSIRYYGPTVTTVFSRTAPAEDIGSYQRAIYLFDGNDPDAVDTARDQWKEAQGEGFEVVYWQQDAEGRWQKKA